jgi:hypothetical protein
MQRVGYATVGIEIRGLPPLPEEHRQGWGTRRVVALFGPGAQSLRAWKARLRAESAIRQRVSEANPAGEWAGRATDLGAAGPVNGYCVRQVSRGDGAT